MQIKRYLFSLLFLTSLSYSQSLYKETTKINDSVDYFLEVAVFNKDDKKSFNKAIIYTEKAIEYAKENNLNEKLADCYLVLGSIHFDLNKMDSAIENFIRSINYYNKKEKSTNLALAYYNLGNCYLEKNKTDLSEIYFNKSAQLYNQLNFPDAIDLINLQKGIIQKNKHNYSEAEIIFQNIITDVTNEDFIDTKVEALFQLGQIYFIKKNNVRSIQYFEKSLKTNKSGNKNIQLEIKILKELSKLYQSTQQFEKSNFYLEKYAEILDSIGSDFNNLISENTFNEIKFDKQLQTIEQLDKEKKSQQRTLRFSKLISILSIALISILSLLSLSLYKNNKIRISTNKLLKTKNKELIAQKEKVELASKARSKFLATVSHELRTPLNAINGITYLLLQENPKPSQLEYLKSLEFSGNYLLNFINDILEINRLESNKVSNEKINFNIVELAENIKTSFNEFISENNIDFRTNIDSSINYNLIGDQTKLSQVLINLLNNAIKFSKNGIVWLTIKKSFETKDEVVLFFEIKDNGIGIPLDKQDSIFDSFSQGSVEINRTFGGTGLGLSIVKKILEIMGSQITLSSDGKSGSTFSFSINFKKSNTITNTDNSEPVLEIDTSNKKILLVEDNKINQMITQKMLDRKNIACVIIDNGEDAIEHMKTNSYDLILMDVHLPGINGTEATAEIRKFNSTIPIIALTAISLNENREMLLSFGMNDVITKPFLPEKFYEIVIQYLTNK
ncbi:ATP-binding protein [Flavobacterium sp. N2270]|uniref:tetratricopeptide repeat-containing hybrid sensor histidine kinase/response regulator n=1 Tax=Flavobacterium sp. N2270 TaxID=2986831 RepID=UPI0022257356|nr:ATP-binding protein [Flavobacterium sp. N2270]